MKKTFSFLIILLMFISIFTLNIKSVNQELLLTSDAKSAILIEPTTLEVIYAKDENVPRSPASMTKIMTLILIMEKLYDGHITLGDMVTTSEKARKITGSKIYLETGEQMSVDHLLKGIAIGSGNDAAIAMAEYIAGSEENFARMMNDKAKAIGANNTNFVNSHGLDADNHYSTAKDISLMAAYLINNYGETVLKYTSVYEDYLRENTEKPFWLVNYNNLVRFVEGMDGLKSGYTDEAGFCLCATLKLKEKRFISVTMGNRNSKMRNLETMQMLNYAMNNYDIINLYPKGYSFKDYKNIKLGDKTYKIIVSEDINVLVKKGETKKNVSYQLNIDYERIQDMESKDIGELLIYYDNTLIKTAKLHIDENIESSSFFSICIMVFKEIFLVSK